MAFVYEKVVLQELSDLLGQFGRDLETESENLQTAAANLAQAWDGNAGLDAFRTSKHTWDQQFGLPGDTGPTTAIGLVKALSTAVEDALHNAVAADTKVQVGFGG
ncbi:hypothetical protein [Nocardia sp. BMG111209]|uniref:hypothetical protein n=1 Tax=Nocardia sp. BMG111209 TaxID=1160137 RepID=UPI00036F50C1|nr:hypothetical protein [Nocardia sp. BMG111209]